MKLWKNVLVSMFIIVVLMMSYDIGHKEGYRQGQIDAMNENIKYKRLYIVQPNGDTTGVIYEYNERIKSEN